MANAAPHNKSISIIDISIQKIVAELALWIAASEQLPEVERGNHIQRKLRDDARAPEPDNRPFNRLRPVLTVAGERDRLLRLPATIAIA